MSQEVADKCFILSHLCENICHFLLSVVYLGLNTQKKKNPADIGSSFPFNYVLFLMILEGTSYVM